MSEMDWDEKEKNPSNVLMTTLILNFFPSTILKVIGFMRIVAKCEENVVKY